VPAAPTSAPLESSSPPLATAAVPELAPSVEPVRREAPPFAAPAPTLQVPPGAALAAPPAGEGSTAHEEAKDLLEACEAELATNPQRLRAGRLHYECGRLLEVEIGDIDAAAEHYQKALSILPDYVPALRGARRVMWQKGLFVGIASLLDREARLTGDPRQKAWLLHQKGRLIDGELGNKPEAALEYAAAIELSHDDPRMLKALERSQVARTAWRDVTATLDQEANAVRSDARHRAALVAERARVTETFLQDPGNATELFQSALSLDPRAPGALHALKRLHHGAQRWHDLAAVLEQEAEQLGEPSARAMTLYRVARIHAEQLGKPEDAVNALERALSQAPEDRMILEELARQYERTNRHAELAGALERLTGLVETAADREALFHRLGQLAEDRLSNAIAAERWYEQALSLNPAHGPTLQALAKLYAKHQKWESLIRVHLGEADHALDAARRAAAHARVAELYERRLGNRELAAAHHGKALGLVPGYAPSFKALVRLYTEGRHFRELCELYERTVEEADDAETKIVYLFKIGRIHEDALNHSAAAVSAYKRIREIDARHLGAIHAWQRAAERSEAHRELVTALETEAELSTDSAKQVALLHRAGEVCEFDLEDDEAALTRYRRVTAQAPRYLPALTSLGRLYYRAGRWDDLCETYRAELGAMPAGREAAALWYKLGVLCEERVGRDAEAVDAYRKAAGMDSSHTVAAHALARKLGEQGRFAELVALLEVEEKRATGADDRARIAFREGEIHEYRLGQPDEALTAYERALEKAPDFRPALDARTRLRAATGNPSRLAEDLRGEAEHAADPVLAVAALLERGNMLKDQLDDAEGAVACFEAVLEREPAHLGALLALESLYSKLGQRDALERVYKSQARVFAAPGARVLALCELLRMEERRGAKDELRQTCFSILELDISNLEALECLERLALAAGDRNLLMDVDTRLAVALGEGGGAAAHQTRLAEALEARGDASALEMYRAALRADPENLAAARGLSRIALRSLDPALLEEAAEREVETSRDLGRVQSLLLASAEVRAAAGDVPGAVAAVERALEKNPVAGPAAQRLVDLLLARGEADRLLDALTHAAQRAKDPEHAAALWMLVSDLLSGVKHDVPAALAALNRVQAQTPGHLPSLLKSAELYAADGQWDQAVTRFQQVLDHKPEPAVAIEANLRMAAILDEKLSDPRRARARLDAVLGIEPDQREGLARLLSLQVREGQAEAAAQTAARLARVSPDAEGRAAALGQMGKLEEGRGRLEDAIAAYEQALRLVGVQGAAAEDFRNLLLRQKRSGKKAPWERYAAALTAYVDQTKAAKVEALVPTFLEAARVRAEELGEPELAVELLNRALALDPDNVAARAELVTRTKAAGDHASALSQAYRLLELDPMRERTWRDVVDVLNGLGRHPEATLAVGGIVALGKANDLEQSTWSARQIRSGYGYAGSIDAAAFASIDALGDASATAVDLVVLLSEGLGKVFSPDLERVGLTVRDRIGPRAGHPLRMLADRVATVFGLGEFDVYIHSAHAGGIEVEFTDPVGLLLPAALANWTESQQVFALARVMVNVARRLHVVDKLPAENVELLLAAAARHVVPGFGSELRDEEYLNNLTRRVHKSVSWLGRGRVDEVATLYSSDPVADVVEWVRRVRLTAARAAVVVADDLPGSVDMLRRTEGDLAGLEGRGLAQGMHMVKDLLRFWISEPAFALRRRLGTL
jgi:tetratricopeptide (TPR) repeat protein